MRLFPFGIFVLIETMWPKIWAQPLPKKAKIPRLVDVCVTKNVFAYKNSINNVIT